MKLAQGYRQIIGEISPPPVVQKLNENDPSGATGVTNFLSTVINLFFVLSSVVFAFMVIWAAYDYIISFGEKDAIARARQKMTWAIVGLVLLSLSFVIFKILEYITDIKFIL